MRCVALLLAVAMTTAVAVSRPAPPRPQFGPDTAALAAYADAQRIPHGDRPFVRYLSLYAQLNLLKAAELDDFLRVLSFQINSLSRKAKLRQVHTPVADSLTALLPPELIRIDLRHFKIDKAVYEKLAKADPWFRELTNEIKFEKVVRTWPGGVWPGDGKHYDAGAFTYEDKAPIPTGEKKVALAPWVPAKEHAWLAENLQTAVPVLRADWFFTQTAVSEERVAGYYDFLELKSRQDFFDLIGFDQKTAQKLEREVATILQRSGVAAKNRQIYRFGATDAGYWQTRDAFERQTKEKNAVNSLNGDYHADAQEHYGFLPNRLFVYYLSDVQGVGQKTAPDKVGFDRSSTSNDGRIHAPLSCVRCHTEGLKPIDDYGRRLWANGNVLAAYDPKQFERFEQLYLLPFKRHLDRDVREYAEALLELNGAGWTPERNASAYRDVWARWYDQDVTLDQAPRELGLAITGEELRARLRKYAAPVAKGGFGQLVPNSLLAFTLDRPLPMLREHFEEQAGLLHKAARGYVPAEVQK